MAMTIYCEECEYTTDIEPISETNPHHCPECGGVLWILGQGEPVAPYYIED